MPLLAQGWIHIQKLFGCVDACDSADRFLSEWREQARRWQRRHPHLDALEISVEQRRLDPKARSAFYVVALARGIRAATPGFEGCCACGQPTHSWCEGCYARIQQSPSNTFSAICQRCDGEFWVCDLCSRVGITHAQGKEAYERSRPGVAVTEETVEVTGWSTSEGFETQTPVHVPLRTIAANESWCWLSVSIYNPNIPHV